MKQPQHPVGWTGLSRIKSKTSKARLLRNCSEQNVQRHRRTKRCSKPRERHVCCSLCSMLFALFFPMDVQHIGAWPHSLGTCVFCSRVVLHCVAQRHSFHQRVCAKVNDDSDSDILLSRFQRHVPTCSSDSVGAQHHQWPIPAGAGRRVTQHEQKTVSEYPWCLQTEAYREQESLLPIDARVQPNSAQETQYWVPVGGAWRHGSAARFDFVIPNFDFIDVHPGTPCRPHFVGTWTFCTGPGWSGGKTTESLRVQCFCIHMWEVLSSNLCRKPGKTWKNEWTRHGEAQKTR